MKKNKVSFGLTLSNRGVALGSTTVKELLELSVLAEESEAFDSIWVGDSIAAKPRLEAVTLLSAVAALTERVKLGPACFASFPLRHPVLLAYQWASFDVVCEGRSIMVTCQGATRPVAGESEIEWAAMDMRLPERALRMEEGIDILRKLWGADEVSHKGRYYNFENLTIEPKPVQEDCPIWIANNPELFGVKEELLNKIARRVAAIADGWQTTLVTPKQFSSAWKRIENEAKKLERCVDKMPRCLYYNCHVNENRELAYLESKEYLDAYYTTDFIKEQLDTWVAMGSPEECISSIQQFIDAGASIITLRFTGRNQSEQLKRFISDIYPAFR